MDGTKKRLNQEWEVWLGEKWIMQIGFARFQGIISVCSLSNLFFRFHTTTLTEACSNELKQH
ncbi:hypothetical protein, partial [Roseburia intestinalis]|uniref:hypothetical protein n=1 Tax=Roseburia intestinalis TaxID=166486 RepID=UPI0006DC67E0